MYSIFALCIAACILVALVSLVGNGSGANEALRRRLDRRVGRSQASDAPVASPGLVPVVGRPDDVAAPERAA